MVRHIDCLNFRKFKVDSVALGECYSKETKYFSRLRKTEVTKQSYLVLCFFVKNVFLSKSFSIISKEY